MDSKARAGVVGASDMATGVGVGRKEAGGATPGSSA
jgi:hypothetical protein